MSYSKWELAKYLIDAKKCVDSVMYIARHKAALANIGLRDRINNILQVFYINCCNVVDNSLSPKERGRLKEENSVINSIYYERDKDKAHKDKKYKKRRFNTLVELYTLMQRQITEVKKMCGKYLPNVLTLDFVPHDRELYRLIYGISPQEEEKIKASKHPHYSKKLQPLQGIEGPLRALEDIEDLNGLSQEEREQFAVLLEEGINGEEGVQNRQDACIKLNVLSGGDMWYGKGKTQ